MEDLKASVIIKRLKQETCPATYNMDFDKNEYLDKLSDIISGLNAKLDIKNIQIAALEKYVKELRELCEKVYNILMMQGFINSAYKSNRAINLLKENKDLWRKS
ncbi:MAG: hypothetical protein J6R47_02805 [Acholeplasmatales bacterium]|nr:hypothetical protein [Acholeplasmatales bacterium]